MNKLTTFPLSMRMFHWGMAALVLAMLALIMLHVAGALYHHFIRKDKVLKTML